MKPMNNRKLSYAPVLAYLFLLLSVWLASWAIGLFQLLSGGDTPVTSLISGAGMRWALLSVQDSLSAAPWGVMALLVFLFGMLEGSGILHFAGRFAGRHKTTPGQRRSMLFAIIALLLYAVALFLLTVYPWKTLSGVSSGVVNSPFSHGWILVLFFAVSALSLTYGFIYGSYRSITDVIATAGDSFSLFIPAFIAMLPASGIVPCLQYTGIGAALGISGSGIVVTETVLYSLPFLYIMVLGMFSAKRCA